MRVEIFTSGIWQTTSTLVERDGRCLVVDPAYFPAELAAIARRVTELGSAAAVVFTHGHWDHVMGHVAFPRVPVMVSAVLADLVSSGDPRAARYLEDAREFDSRWYVPRPEGHRWPERLHPLAGDERATVAGTPIHALHLPGHSPDGLGLLIDDGQLLLVGDYLSPCEIPFVDDAAAYHATLRHLLDLIEHGVRRVIPGHGRELTSTDAAAIARADLAYLDQLIDAGSRGDASTAAAITLPRAADVVGMRDHHRDNCARVGLAAIR